MGQSAARRCNAPVILPLSSPSQKQERCTPFPLRHPTGVGIPTCLSGRCQPSMAERPDLKRYVCAR